ncbi:MAG TPA: ADOP family duplicated permease [Opitutaceae bacterium]|nr:ADOP family duplicated permease [Opitutaceae bacterium]
MTSALALGLRSLRRTPLLAFTIVITLGVALAATVLVFTFLNSFLLRPLPYGDADRLTVVFEQSVKGGRDHSTRVTYGNIVALEERATSFARTGVFRNESATFYGGDTTETAFIQRVTAHVFPMMGARAALGSVLGPANLEVGGVRGIVLSDSLWRRRFGADPAIVGRTIRLDQTPFHVVGVLPADFVVPSGDDNPQAWAALLPGDYVRDERTQRRHHVWAELKPGVSLAAAQAELDAIAAALRTEYPRENADRGFFVLPLREHLLGTFGRRLLLLQGAVLLVLVVACFNCLCLLIARAIQRRRELAVRLALGAARRHLLQQLLAESLWLALPAAGLAVALAAVALPASVALLPAGAVTLQALPEPRLDLSAALAVTGAAAAIALTFSAVPLLQARGLPLEATLREGGRSAGSPSGARAARWLASAQIAAALALLIAAALLVRSRHELERVDVGLPLAEYDQFRVGLRGDAYREPLRRAQFFTQLRDDLAALPGVQGVGVASFLFSTPPSGFQGFTQEGDGLDLADTPKRALPCFVLPGTIEALGFRLREGRTLEETDAPGRPVAAVISASLAEKYWPGQSPLGRRIRMETIRAEWLEVVGVVSDLVGPGNQPRTIDTVYVTIAQGNPPGLGMGFIVRGAARRDSREYQQVLSRLDPHLQLFAHLAPGEIYARSAWQSRFVTQLVAGFAALAVALALAGIYAVNAFFVERRIHEFGVRAALGASRANLLRLVLGDSLRLTLAGLGAGMVLAYGVSRGLASLLFNVGRLDPLVYAAAALAMTLACAVAALVPARRAAKVDPLVALRSE